MPVCSCLFNPRKISEQQKLLVRENGPKLYRMKPLFQGKSQQVCLCQKFNELDVLNFYFSQTSQVYSSKIFKQRANITSSTEHPADQRPLWGRTGTGQALGGPSSAS